MHLIYSSNMFVYISCLLGSAAGTEMGQPVPVHLSFRKLCTGRNRVNGGVKLYGMVEHSTRYLSPQSLNEAIGLPWRSFQNLTEAACATIVPRNLIEWPITNMCPCRTVSRHSLRLTWQYGMVIIDLAISSDHLPSPIAPQYEANEYTSPMVWRTAVTGTVFGMRIRCSAAVTFPPGCPCI